MKHKSGRYTFARMRRSVVILAFQGMYFPGGWWFALLGRGSNNTDLPPNSERAAQARPATDFQRRRSPCTFYGMVGRDGIPPSNCGPPRREPAFCHRPIEIPPARGIRPI